MTGDHIELRGLRVLGRCGAAAAERAVPQPLEIDLDLRTDLAAAAAADDLALTVDYGRVCDVVADAISGEAVTLLEHLALCIADALLADDGRIDVIDVVVRKLRPPVPHALASAGVRLVRSRSAPQP